jgi:hypothetical protein
MRYEARIAKRAEKSPAENPSLSATAVDARPHDNAQRVPVRRATWNPAPVLDPLADLYRR